MTPVGARGTTGAVPSGTFPGARARQDFGLGSSPVVPQGFCGGRSRDDLLRQSGASKRRRWRHALAQAGLVALPVLRESAEHIAAMVLKAKNLMAP